MSNKLLIVLIILPLILGCGIADRVQKAVTESGSNTSTTPPAANANKSLTDQAIDTAVGEKKVGIAECDEAIEILAAQANDPNDNFVTKAVKKTALNTFREQLKQQLENNKTDPKELAKFCKEFRDNMADSLKSDNSNTGGSY